MAVSIGEAAKAAGVTTRAVRLYESRGLLPEPDRTPAGYRMFTDEAISVLTFIRQGRSLGLSLDGIAEILELSRAGAPCDRTRALLDQRVAEIDATIRDLQGLRSSIEKAQRIPRGTSADRCAVIQGAEPSPS